MRVIFCLILTCRILWLGCFRQEKWGYKVIAVQSFVGLGNEDEGARECGEKRSVFVVKVWKNWSQSSFTLILVVH